MINTVSSSRAERKGLATCHGASLRQVFRDGELTRNHHHHYYHHHRLANTTYTQASFPYVAAVDLSRLLNPTKILTGL
ncbi:hypothetical protein E2C01_053823 [Portunus trituberculatus]|uniref:Uncharacterized protein n=1 Tax=Portunus trituberculatus TaxID=210409 RepID=A0A5B7GR33_PORTR|nr:hypothetical protein [Portunus trituberculatus]